MSNWLKAGLIGAAVVVVVNVAGLIPVIGPCLACIGFFVVLVTYGGVGALAAYWMPPVRMAGPAAGQGALAGLIASAIGGAVGLVISTAQAALFPAQMDAIWGFLPPEALQGMYEAGLDPSMFTGPGVGVVGSLVGGSFCCAIGLAIGAGLGALGGVIFAAMKSE